MSQPAPNLPRVNPEEGLNPALRRMDDHIARLSPTVVQMYERIRQANARGKDFHSSLISPSLEDIERDALGIARSARAALDALNVKRPSDHLNLPKGS